MPWFRVPIWREVESWMVVEAQDEDEAKNKILLEGEFDIIENPEGEEILSDYDVDEIEEFAYQQELPLYKIQ